MIYKLIAIIFLNIVSSPLIKAIVEKSIHASASSFLPLEENFHHDLDELTLAVGETHACALEHVGDAEIGGEVVCWGSNDHHESDSPAGLFVQITASSQHTCGISIDERIVCWGDSAPIALRSDARKNTPLKGGITSESKNTQKLVQNKNNRRALGKTSPSSSYVQISSGSNHVCAVDLFGFVECWGSANHRGQLDVPVIEDTSLTSLNGKGAFVQVSCGNDQSCVLKKDGTINCWGSPRGGLLRPPTGQYVQVSVSPRGHACAITLSGGLKCWGSIYGPSGGEGTFNGTYVQVSAGDRFTCAIRASGTLFCFGDERTLNYGSVQAQIQNNGEEGQQQMTAPLPDTSFLEITAAASGTAICGITAGSSPKVKCWGESVLITTRVPKDLEPSALPLTIF
jgi:alpha-tubulin suppressor-like RCC1 family protein